MDNTLLNTALSKLCTPCHDRSSSQEGERSSAVSSVTSRFQESMPPARLSLIRGGLFSPQRLEEARSGQQTDEEAHLQQQQVIDLAAYLRGEQGPDDDGWIGDAAA